MTRQLIESRRHVLAVTLPPAPLAVYGDCARIAQVLGNLLNNAAKYSEPGSQIALDVGESGNDVVFRVRDSGIGIPELDRPRVFERFYRVDKARSRELGGTGLGLAIVKHIVEGHGGQVWVEGNSPTGSRFVVRLPVS